MRKLLILLVAALITAALLTAGLDARTYRSAKSKTRHVMVTKHGKKMVCHPVTKHRRVIRRARIVKPAMPAAGPKEPVVVNCPAPTVSVPPASVTCPAPQVNMQPSVGITVDNCNIYIVRENELWVVGKDDLCVKKKATLTPPSTTGPPAMQ